GEAEQVLGDQGDTGKPALPQLVGHRKIVDAQGEDEGPNEDHQDIFRVFLDLLLQRNRLRAFQWKKRPACPAVSDFNPALLYIPPEAEAIRKGLFSGDN